MKPLSRVHVNTSAGGVFINGAGQGHRGWRRGVDRATKPCHREPPGQTRADGSDRGSATAADATCRRPATVSPTPPATSGVPPEPGPDLGYRRRPPPTTL